MNKKIILLIPILLMFIPSQIFAESAEPYQKNIKKYCEPTNREGFWAACSVNFEHVSGKPFTIDLKMNDNNSVWLTLDSCSPSFNKCTEGENYERSTEFRNSFVKTYNSDYDEVRVWLSNDKFYEGINFELNFYGYQYTPAILEKDSVLPFPTLIILIILIVIAAFVLLVIRARKQIKKMQKHRDSLVEQDINALNIIKERLAKGEITKEEYDNLKKEFE